MGAEKKCSLFRSPEIVNMGRESAIYDIDSSSTTCEENTRVCDRPDSP